MWCFEYAADIARSVISKPNNEFSFCFLGFASNDTIWDNRQTFNTSYQHHDNQPHTRYLTTHDGQISFDNSNMHRSKRNTELPLTNSNIIQQTNRNSIQLNIPSQFAASNSKDVVPKYYDMPPTNRNLNLSGNSQPCVDSAIKVANAQVIAPPPLGFEDNEFYLTETQPLTQEDTNDNNGSTHFNFKLRQRRQRPKMTLSFAGLDNPRQGSSASNQTARTLMFATNSPFALNDCVEIDPNLSLERQE